MVERAPPETGWSWFETEAPTLHDAALEDSFQRCFSSPAGVRVLMHLCSLTLDRVLGPEATPAALRHLEGQRALVLLLLRLSGRLGRPQAAAQPSPSPLLGETAP
jgi:hypothetical protein